MRFKFEMKLKQIQITPQYEMEKSLFEACLKHYRDTEDRYFELMGNKKLIDINTGEELVMIDGKLRKK